jgi:hypothetical protein
VCGALAIASGFVLADAATGARAGDAADAGAVAVRCDAAAGADAEAADGDGIAGGTAADACCAIGEDGAAAPEGGTTPPGGGAAADAGVAGADGGTRGAIGADVLGTIRSASRGATGWLSAGAAAETSCREAGGGD